MAKEHWIYAGNTAEKLSGERVLEYLSGGRLVKDNPVRQVWECGPFFFKIDKRGVRRLRQEFANALCLEKAGVPVVGHLACGSLADGSGCLVTRALKEAVSLEDMLRSDLPGADVFSALGKLLEKMRNAKVRHRDFHSGNLLYAENEKAFYLCDVRDAVPVKWWNFPRFSLFPYWKLIAELRCGLPQEMLFPLLKENQAEDPEKTLHRIMLLESCSLQKEWKRRKRQVLSGYAKFTRKSGDLLLHRDISPQTALQGDTLAAGPEYFAFAFYLDLARLPHRQVFAFNESENCVYLEGYPQENADPALVKEYIRRAEIYGIRTSESMWKCDRRGRIKLADWQSIVQERKTS